MNMYTRPIKHTDVRTCIHAHVCTYLHTYIRTHVHPYVPTYTHIIDNEQEQKDLHREAFADLNEHLHDDDMVTPLEVVFRYAGVYVYVYVYVCLCW